MVTLAKQREGFLQEQGLARARLIPGSRHTLPQLGTAREAHERSDHSALERSS
jgi:hypothetical protein